MSEPAFRCASAARDRDDPVTGTAPPATRWLLLEHPGPWPVDAVAGSGIEPRMLARVTGGAGRTGTRILLIRRPGRRPRPQARQWILASLDGATVAGEWATDADLEAAVTALAAPIGPTTTPPAPLILVCAHGVHDACCAVRGRPVAAALSTRWPDGVWECSHVGGDRFAPNVVLLPDGFYYGNLDPESAERVVSQHLAGVVSTEHLRGMSRFPPAAQAAAAAAYEQLGPLGPPDVRVRSFAHVRPRAEHASHSTVVLRVAGLTADLRVEVVGLRRPEAQLTCRAGRETPATTYRVESLEPVPRD